MIKFLQLIWHGCWHQWEPTGEHADHFDISFGHKSFMYRATRRAAPSVGDTECSKTTLAAHSPSLNPPNQRVEDEA